MRTAPQTVGDDQFYRVKLQAESPVPVMPPELAGIILHYGIRGAECQRVRLLINLALCPVRESNHRNIGVAAAQSLLEGFFKVRDEAGVRRALMKCA